MVDYYHQTFQHGFFFPVFQNSDNEGPAQSYSQSASEQCKCQVPNLKLLSPPLAI